MKKILISAFTPFYKSVNNYSKEVLDYIESSSLDITKVVIDVVYDECFKELSNYNLDEFDLIIALGEARSRNVLTMEQQALNISSCSIADNKAILKNEEKIIEEQEEVLITKLNIQNCTKYAEISTYAGKFVCNNLYFHLLNYNANKCLFIHVPECNNDVSLYQKYAIDVINIIKSL